MPANFSTADLQELRDALDAIEDMKRALQSIKNEFDNPQSLYDDVITKFYIPYNVETFRTDGRGTWAPTKRPNPILRDTYALYNSFTDISDPKFLYISTPDGFEVGSKVHYWYWHEFGWDDFRGSSEVPPRPITGLIDEDDPELEEVVVSWFDDLATRAGF